MILLVLSLAFWISTVAESPVPDILPDDLGGKTLYGYLMDLKTTYAPSKVFSDAAKYSDADRENARRALHLIDDAATKKMEELQHTIKTYKNAIEILQSIKRTHKKDGSDFQNLWKNFETPENVRL